MKRIVPFYPQITQPVNAGDAFFNNTLDFLEEVRIFLVNPMCHISSIIEDLKKQKAINKLLFKGKIRSHYWFLKGKCYLITEVNRTIFGSQPSTFTQRSMHHQKSSSDSPFHANTGRSAMESRGQDGRECKKVTWTLQKWTMGLINCHKSLFSPCSAKAAATSSWVE